MEHGWEMGSSPAFALFRSECVDGMWSHVLQPFQWVAEKATFTTQFLACEAKADPLGPQRADYERGLFLGKGHFIQEK